MMRLLAVLARPLDHFTNMLFYWLAAGLAITLMGAEHAWRRWRASSH